MRRMDGFTRFGLGLLFAIAVGWVPTSEATTVTSFAAASPAPAYGVWYESDIQVGGTAGTVNLTGMGGNLESAQPLPVGAALLTTGPANEDKAQVGVDDAYGNANTVLNDSSFQLDYWYYKDATAVQNNFAAPSIKLSLSNPSASGDGYGTLVFEPYWQGPIVPDVWTAVSITATSGLFWWDGGFGVSNSMGGPPLQTLSEWTTALGADVDFADADLVTLSMGVGTYNQSQTGYFDAVSLSYTGYSASYNFEPIPEPSTALLLLLGLVGLAKMGRGLHHRSASR